MTAASQPERLVVHLSERELAELIAVAVRRELASQRPVPAHAARNERLTIKEAAERLRCSERHVRRLIALQRLSATRLTAGGSSRVMVSRASLERLIGGEP
jgi:excisionase family DNA binding protein